MKKSLIGLTILVAASAYASDLAKVVNRSVEKINSKALSRALGDSKVVSDEAVVGCEFRASQAEGEPDTLACNPSIEKMNEQDREVTIARALANSHYAEIEGEWLKYLGESEAWIMRDGRAVKMSSGHSSVAGKLLPSTARDLFASFVGREVSHLSMNSQADTDRKIASDDQPSLARRDSNDAENTVRRLLEMN